MDRSDQRGYGAEAAQLCPPSARHPDPGARFPAGVQVVAGGVSAPASTSSTVAYGAFPGSSLAVLLLPFLLLMRAFRSLILPLKAVL